MSDIRCLPGMEGRPVFNEHAGLIGILTSTIRWKAIGIEIQLVVTWNAISTAWRDEQQRVQRRTRRNQDGYDLKKAGSYNNTDFHRFLNYYTQELPKKTGFGGAMCLWKFPCVVLNNQGLKLTSAHTLQPLRFPTKRPLIGMDVTTFPALSTISMCKQERSDDKNLRQWSSPSLVETMNGCVGDVSEKCYERLYVRLDHTEPPVWCYATAVYVSKGPLDVALLQLESFPNQLRPITPHFGCPSPASKAFVIGHGLFGPTSGLYPFVYSVVARVVEKAYGSGVPVMLPVMLETSSSGGAVVNSDGDMIGLATRRLGTIPFLDFNIPSEALRLIFDFSRGIGDLSILQQALDKPNEFLSSVWGLKQQPSSQRLGPFPYQPKSLVGKINEGKGPRFVNFLAEKRAETFPGEPPPSMDKPIKEEFLAKILPSKL